MIKRIIVFIVIFLPCFSAMAQSSSSGSMRSSYFDMSEFPQWSRDLRRGEIVALGSFPFAYFFTTFFYDTYRYVDNGNNSLYAPWPVKPAGAIEYTQSEHFKTLGVAAGVSVAIAVVDYFIVRNKRKKQAQEQSSSAVEAPVIIRRPLNEVINDGVIYDGAQNSMESEAANP